ncbi:DUF6457 domain-containing protein [Cumulibacter soli]|uniref:DUF6457 domain-containing protein n=1 Tax=Cumulibacter soli TaxID=2546344 RepID=UPI001FBA0F74|nr:DUF6457 domain-containing protein [Cumulibacter soli]
MASREQQWDIWVDRACTTLGVDPETVDITAIHALTKRVAHNLDRPLAPVSSYILGVAVGLAAADNAVDPATRDALMQRLLSTVPDDVN